MILDTLDHYHIHAPAGSRLQRAFQFLATEWNPSMPDGRVDVLGDDVFALIQGYDTRAAENCRFEAHRRYIDIQYVVEGAEAMGWARVDTLSVTEPYSDEKDVGFFATPAAYATPVVYAGSYTVFHPHDAHMPGLRVPSYDRVRKVVMKIRV